MLKRILFIILILLISQVCFAGRLQEMQKAVIAAKNGAGGGDPCADCTTSNDSAQFTNKQGTATFDITGNNWFAQPFTTDSNGICLTELLAKGRDTNQTGSVKVSIQGDSSGSPNGTDVTGSAVTIGHASLSDSAVEVLFTLSATIQLSPSTTYYYVVKGVSGMDWSINYDTAGGYAGSVLQYTTNAGSSWNESESEDMYFEINGCTP